MITKDMLLAKGATQGVLNDFIEVFPTGFDWAITTYTFDAEEAKLVDYLAATFDYTGKYVCRSTFGDEIHINYINGKRNDYANGDPCCVEYDIASGAKMVIAFFKDGRLNNPVPCKPAVIGFDEFGGLEFRSFFEDGLRNDPSPGVPALVYYTPTGEVDEEIHYDKGIALDP